MTESRSTLEAFHRTLVEEIRRQRPEYLSGPFTVAEIYQNLVPYGSHRDRIGVEMNADYEDALLRLLAGEGDFLVLESAPALRGIREELESSNPNTGLYREYAAVDVRLNPLRSEDSGSSSADVESQPVPDELPALAWEAESDEAPVAMEDLAPALDLDDAPEDPMEDPIEDTPAAAPVVVAEVPDAPSDADRNDDESACRWCRATLPERNNLRFCPFCGMDSNLKPCGVCGEELEAGWRFCISCGTEVAE